ncbi:hypothetical protein NPIL_146561 [Nephila pilipes]|uniref:Uncharacterized protein n=1 Tax=Nephila pilipes TaxID=299642 RepID=A0A8X6P3B9_NEPPI|nr:hypothetical protein NPIL_146561 [Nephila pilipes]
MGSWQTLGLTTILNILHGVLNQYPYKLQSYHNLLPSDTIGRVAFVRWALYKFEQDSSWKQSRVFLVTELLGLQNPIRYMELQTEADKLFKGYDVNESQRENG